MGGESRQEVLSPGVAKQGTQSSGGPRESLRAEAAGLADRQLNVGGRNRSVKQDSEDLSLRPGGRRS